MSARARTWCASSSSRPPRSSSPLGQPRSFRPAGRHAHCAARHSIRPATFARGATATPTEPADDEAVLELLRDGELEIVGRLTEASNATFLARVTLGPDITDLEDDGWGEAEFVQCVYK